MFQNLRQGRRLQTDVLTIKYVEFACAQCPLSNINENIFILMIYFRQMWNTLHADLEKDQKLVKFPKVDIPFNFYCKAQARVRQG